jgi:hypothetical protein
VEPVIGYCSRTLINFRSFAFDDPLDHGFRWVDVKRFRLCPAPPVDELVLRSLIDDDQFADGYAGGGADPTGETHGPYQLGRITTDAYEHLDAAPAFSVIDDWARQYGSLPVPLAGALEAQLYAPIRDATSLYRLKDLDEGAFHDLVVHGEFYELVVIDRATSTLLLVVAADD